MSKLDNRAEVALSFLRRIAQNNNREWFHAHRELYDEARAAFESMVADLIPQLAQVDEAVGRLTVKDCTYRFYRDTRFSVDKSPYKQHFGAYLAPHGKKALQGGYYLHLEPDNCMLAGGAYCLPTKVLRAVRRSIVDELEEFRGIVETPDFQAYFPVIGMEHLRTLPQGFPKDFPFPQYLRPKDYSCSHNVPDTFFAKACWLDKSVRIFSIMKPFLDFVNYAIDEEA